MDDQIEIRDLRAFCHNDLLYEMVLMSLVQQDCGLARELLVKHTRDVVAKESPQIAENYRAFVVERPVSQTLRDRVALTHTELGAFLGLIASASLVLDRRTK